MPVTILHFFRDIDGTVPVLEWFDELSRRDRRGLAECIARLDLLARFGHELRRPYADFLRDGIYELRAKRGRVDGRQAIILAHGLTKERDVPAADINRAIVRRKRYEQNPQKHRSIQSIQRPADQ